MSLLFKGLLQTFA